MPLVLYDRPVDLPCGDVVFTCEVEVHEPLVVPEVQVDLASVVEHIDLPVFEQVHGTRVDVQVRIYLDGRHLDPPGLQKTSYGRCGNSLPESRDHPSADENQLHNESTGFFVHIRH